MKWQKFPFKIEKQFRLPGWDYSNNGYYFVTICTQNRNVLFVGTDPLFPFVGTDPCVRSWNKNYKDLNKLSLNGIGKMVEKWWLKIPQKFSNTILDNFVIMPNHLHGIVIIKAQTRVSVPTENKTKFGHVGLLGEIIQWFKTMTTNEYISGMKENNWPKFNKRIWQPRFHDRIIRNEKEYFAIKQYIGDNPKNWLKDKNFRL